jgi:hypothetical protein
MAFLAPLVAGPLGNLGLAAIGIGLQLLAAYFFPQKVKGPRLEDLKQQTSRYGDEPARLYGSARVAAAVIWLKNNQLDEHKDTHRKGSIGPVITEFTYTADVALAFCWNGPVAGVPRMWADDKLCYDNSAETLEKIINGDPVAGTGAAEGATFRFYLGSQTQGSDPDIIADRGSAPAWPGRCYVVITNFPCDEFGRRLPNFEAEVVRAGSDATLSVTPPGMFPAFDTQGNFVVSSNGSDTVKIHNLPSGTLRFTITLPAALGGAIWITKRGKLALASLLPGTLWIYNLETGVLEFEVTWTGAGYPFNTPTQSFGDIIVDGDDYLFLQVGVDVVCFKESAGQTGWTQIALASIGVSVITGILVFSVGLELLYMIKNDSGTYRLMTSAISGGVASTAIVRTPPSLSGTPKGIFYDRDSDSVLIVTHTGLYVYDATLDTLLGSRSGDWTLLDYPNMSQRIWSGAGTFIVRDDGSNNVYEYQLSGLGLVQTILAATTTWTDKSNANVGLTAVNLLWRALAVYGSTAGPHVWFLPRLARGSVTLASVLAEECALAGVACDVSAVTGTVRGYAARGGETPRGVIEDLARVKFFDFAQDAGVLKFFMRSATPVRSIILNDMGFSRDTPEPRLVREDYGDASETPARVIIDYGSLNGDYRKGSQSIAKPDGLDAGATTIKFQTNLVLTDDEAAKVADIFLNDSRAATTTYRTSVHPKFLETHPGDVVTLELDSNRDITAVITKQQGELPLSLELRKRITVYTSDAVGNPVDPNPDGLLGRARSDSVLIDGHLMRREDNDDSFYLTIYPAERGKLPSATVYKSNDAINYGALIGFRSASLVGNATSALPDRPNPWAIDRASILTFAVASVVGVENFPVAVTEAQLLADGTLNAFALRSGSEWEYLRAASVVDNNDGTWTISTLIRGRRGTEFAMAGHATGDTIVYLDPLVLARAPEADRDLLRYFVTLTSGKAFSTTYAKSFTNQGRGLRPWAPVAVMGSRNGSGDLVVTAVRRDRLGESELVTSPPMSEASELYHMRVYDGVDVVRSFSNSVLSFSYDAANQTSDFGSPQASVDVQIVQISATFTGGDGVPAIATV